MFGIGSQELIIILVIALVVFGAKSLPDLGKNLGQSIRGFQKAMNEPPAKNGDEKEPRDPGTPR